MARKLNNAQKRLLDTAPKGTIFFEDLPHETQEKLNSLNSYENMWSDAERYLDDKLMNERYGRV